MTMHSHIHRSHVGQPDTIVEEPPRRRSTLLTGLHPGASRPAAAGRCPPSCSSVVSLAVLLSPNEHILKGGHVA